MTDDLRALVQKLADYNGAELTPLDPEVLDVPTLDEDDPDDVEGFLCLLVQDSVSAPSPVELWIAGEMGADTYGCDKEALLVRDADALDDEEGDADGEFIALADLDVAEDACLFGMDALPVLMARYALAREPDENEEDEAS